MSIITNTAIDEMSYDAPGWDPCLPPNWRHLDAVKLADGTEPRWAMNDAVILPCVEFYKALNAATDDREKAMVKCRWPAIAVAQETSEQDDPKRWELEARLLVGQSDEQIATRCHVPAEVVNWYEAVYFNVRPRLRAWGYLLNQAVGDGLHRGFRDNEVANFWAWVAIGGGPLVLERIVETFHSARQAGEPATLSVYLRPDAGVDPRIQAVVANSVLPHYGPGAEPWMEFRRRIQDGAEADDEDRRALLRERVRNDLVRCGRAFLANEPLPRFQRRQQIPKDRDRSAALVHGLPPGETTLSDGIGGTEGVAPTPADAIFGNKSIRPPQA